jgi:hypothetical protein
MLFFPLRYKAPLAFPQMFSLYIYSYTILSDSLSLGFKVLTWYHCTYVEVLRRTTESLKGITGIWDQDISPGQPENEWVLTTCQLCSFDVYQMVI